MRKILVLKNTRRGLKALIDGEMISGVTEIVVTGLPRDGIVTLKLLANRVVFEQETIEEAAEDRGAVQFRAPANAEGEGR